MKLTIGENIRKYRKKNDLTQEELAERLGVTYQSVSRWENGTTYPDLELLPSISELLAVTVDELIGMSQIEKEKRAKETFDELRRECIKKDYDSDKIISLIRDIRRNYIDSKYSYRPWCEGNDRAFRDPKILPELRLFADAYLERNPMNPHTIQTMANAEEEEKLDDFLLKYTTSFDCSERVLLFERYFRRRDAEHFEEERRFQLYSSFVKLLCPKYLHKWDDDNNEKCDEFRMTALEFIRQDAVDDRPDMWVEDRLELYLNVASRHVAEGDFDEGISKIESAVNLLEATMAIKGETVLPTSCSFLDGMKWVAKENWHTRRNDPDSCEERHISIFTEMKHMSSGYGIYPSDYFRMLKRKAFDPIRNRPEFEKLCDRIKALIVTRVKE